MSRIVAAVVLAFLVAGCTLGPVWSRRLEGRVIDERTGKPVAGAVVTASYRVLFLGTHGSGGDLQVGSTMTDADGRFQLHGRFSFVFGPLAMTRPNPEVRAFHPEFGLGMACRGSHCPSDRLDLEIRMEDDDDTLDDLLVGNRPRGICDGAREETCQRLCQAAYADAGLCTK